MSSNYPPGTWEGDPRAPWNAPDEPDEDWILDKAREYARNDGQMYDNLPATAKAYYRECAEELWYEGPDEFDG